MPRPGGPADGVDAKGLECRLRVARVEPWRIRRRMGVFRARGPRWSRAGQVMVTRIGQDTKEGQIAFLCERPPVAGRSNALTDPSRAAANGIVGAWGTNEATFELDLRTILSASRGRPGKEIVVNYRSSSSQRVLRNALVASALATGLTAMSNIRPASANVVHGQRNYGHNSTRSGDGAAFPQYYHPREQRK
jgi:hypothetical protein